MLELNHSTNKVDFSPVKLFQLTFHTDHTKSPIKSLLVLKKQRNGAITLDLQVGNER